MILIDEGGFHIFQVPMVSHKPFNVFPEAGQKGVTKVSEDTLEHGEPFSIKAVAALFVLKTEKGTSFSTFSGLLKKLNTILSSPDISSGLRFKLGWSLLGAYIISSPPQT